MDIKGAAKTSEFWVTIGSILGTVAEHAHLIPQDTWEKVVWPAGVYIVSRIISKTAKATVK